MTESSHPPEPGDEDQAAALAAIDEDYPGWHAWTGVVPLFYARRPRSVPALVVRAGDLNTLRAEIEHAERERGLRL